MNIQIEKHKNNISIIRVMDNHPEVLEDKTEILNAKLLFVSKDNRIEEVITDLIPPVSLIYGPRRETRIILRQKVRRMTGLGILIALKHNNLKLLQAMKAYKGLANKTTAYKLYEISMLVADAIELYKIDAVSFGFTDEEIELFRTVVTSYGTILSDTDNQLNDRKASRTELVTLIKDCNKILKEQFDPFANFVSEQYPDYFREYSLLRVGPSRKKTTNVSLAELGEISGTVYDSVTNLPLEGVTVTIPGFDLVTVTDEDGYYLFGDLLIGAYRLKCSFNGYQVPADQTAKITADITTVDVDFSLVPVVA